MKPSLPTLPPGSSLPRTWIHRQRASRRTAIRFTGGAFLAALLAIPFGTTAAEPAAAAASFRSEVEAVQNAAHRHPDRSGPYWEELEKGFRGLQARFPEEAEVYAELLFVADHRADPRGAALAREILAWPAPAEVKEKAEGVLRKKKGLGQPFELQATTTEGAIVRIADWRGKVVLIDFWATWCPPCREKLPALRDLHTRLHPRGLEIVGFSFDDDLDKLRRFVAAEKIPWPQVADGKGWTESPRARESGLTSLPAMWLIDRKGRLRDIEAGEDLGAKVERLLAE